MTGASPEVELLLRCARTRVDPPGARHVRRLARAGIDWAALDALARRHKVTPLVCRSLRSVCRSCVPRDVLRSLAARTRAVARANETAAATLLEIAGALRADGIRMIAYKGPTLAAVAYGDVGVREFNDLDLLVREADYLAAKRALLALGFRSRLRLENEHSFVRPPGPGVDLHRRFTHESFRLPLDADELLPHVRPLAIADGRVDTLAPEQLLPIVCVHATAHCWSQLRWTCDVAELVGRESLAWDAMLRWAAALGASRIVHVGLRLAIELLDASVPASIASLIERDAAARRLAGDVRARLVADAAAPVGAAARRILLDSRERIRDRAWYSLALVRAGLDVDGPRRPWVFAGVATAYRLLRPLRPLWRLARRRVMPPPR
ncbi:hypothetical protein J421_5528 (plasmid) [Gemmatirosa kalamazoonensis]|uniref:Nucleotidyltransferase family protein n=1 Tax=Gemmatirosa kalamazoonensis TaxID=861299 RepID=W0RTZ3_9BACT|nr:nucleotidyltransferase family protein [Gemmatirosa kalamazoonensis]AHG93063.1 hypothetical protein J421_5528 [Gemmatirosa kalamazoonensis]